MNSSGQELVHNDTDEESPAITTLVVPLPNPPSSHTFIAPIYQWWQMRRPIAWWNGTHQTRIRGGDAGPLSSIGLIATAMISFVYTCILFGNTNAPVGSTEMLSWLSFTFLWSVFCYRYATFILPMHINERGIEWLRLLIIIMFILSCGILPGNIVLPSIPGTVTLSMVVFYTPIKNRYGIDPILPVRESPV